MNFAIGRSSNSKEGLDSKGIFRLQCSGYIAAAKLVGDVEMAMTSKSVVMTSTVMTSKTAAMTSAVMTSKSAVMASTSAVMAVF